ncbi:EF-P beta-lysylation protein EpmB [Alteromonas lipolytica]|uniref:L-lysine 2,3-aminomutase n=1 Tax=Alteromonas lipolytica TaxID=1856405 RepID=A0A1E8FFV4_9ALTE|nr:EF-P beta-lysylation protein EpmB [Alteromonas lipolytica]OFI34478.1 EF-P beta-lysylation protein EpmB [Alteromonas lipolytica]GGF84893.1 EF-P beta-lysylation protein EpmB [Alteromonas lipolytica]
MAQIIQKNSISVEQNWQKELASGFTDPFSLLKYLNLDPSDFGTHAEARRLFPMRVPRHFASLMEKGNWQDPLLLQVLPSNQEFLTAPGYSADPLEEHDTANPGLLHKYQSRVLLIVKGGCAVNCRYCFRRHFPYAENSLSQQQLEANIAYIAEHPEINEVILSGGDPLMARDDKLAALAEKLAALPHIKRLRIHTRLPVVMPERLDNAFYQWLINLPLQKVLVLHINHAKEVSPQLIDRLAPLRQAGVTLLNQAVLLKGVNASAETQAELNEAVFDAGIMPYYLHLLDKVQGAAHFDIDMAQARAIMAEVIKRLPGFMVPKLVTEIGGQPGKTPIDLRLHPQD